MSEVQFSTVSQFVQFLEESPDATLDKAYVVETLKEISNRPASSGQRRGQLAGLTLEDMSDEQLKREIINAKSVHYKAVQRGASAETIEKNQARVDAALAEKARRTPEAPVVEEVATEGSEEVYAEGTDSAEF